MTGRDKNAAEKKKSRNRSSSLRRIRRTIEAEHIADTEAPRGFLPQKPPAGDVTGAVTASTLFIAAILPELEAVKEPVKGDSLEKIVAGVVGKVVQDIRSGEEGAGGAVSEQLGELTEILGGKEVPPGKIVSQLLSILAEGLPQGGEIRNRLEIKKVRTRISAGGSPTPQRRRTITGSSGAAAATSSSSHREEISWIEWTNANTTTLNVLEALRTTVEVADTQSGEIRFRDDDGEGGVEVIQKEVGEVVVLGVEREGLEIDNPVSLPKAVDIGVGGCQLIRACTIHGRRTLGKPRYWFTSGAGGQIQTYTGGKLFNSFESADTSLIVAYRKQTSGGAGKLALGGPQAGTVSRGQAAASVLSKWGLEGGLFD